MYMYFFIYSILVSFKSEAASWKGKPPAAFCLHVCSWYCWDRSPKDDAASLKYLKKIYSSDSKFTTLSPILTTEYSEKLSNGRWLFKPHRTSSTTSTMATTKKEEPPVYVIVVNVPTATPAAATTTTTTTPRPTTQQSEFQSVYVIVVTPSTTMRPSTTTTTSKPAEGDDDHWICETCKKKCEFG